jgi:hypothetical protein
MSRRKPYLTKGLGFSIFRRRLRGAGHQFLALALESL